MEVGTIATWVKKEGEAFGPGDVLCEVETDKATVSFDAQDEGVVAKILVQAGTEVKVRLFNACIRLCGRRWSLCHSLSQYQCSSIIGISAGRDPRAGRHRGQGACIRTITPMLLWHHHHHHIRVASPSDEPLQAGALGLDLSVNGA